MNKNFFFLSVLILFLAAIPRCVELLSGNYLFGYDQGLFFQAVEKIVIDHKFTLIGAEVGGQGGFFQGPGWYYLLAIPFTITGGDPYGAMVLMFLIGITTVILTLTLGRKMFGEKTAIFVGLLVAISPEVITQSRFIWPPFPISLLTVLFLFFLFNVLERSEKFLPFLTFTVGLMFHFETAIGATLLAQLIIFSLVLIMKRLVSMRFFFFSVASFFLPLAPLFLFDVRHEFIMSKGLLKFFSGQANPPHAITQRYVEAIVRDHFGVFWSNFLSTFHYAHTLWPVLLLILFLGSIIYVRDRKRSFAQRTLVCYLLISPFVLFLIFMLYLWPIWQWWLLELIIYYCFLLGILAGYFWKRPLFRLFITIMLIIFLVGYSRQAINFYTIDLYDFGGIHKIKGKLEAIDYIYQDAKDEKFGLFIFTPPIYTYAYDYLLWWHGERKYHYRPHQDKKGLFYLLIEQDPHKQWTYKGWLETVIKTGKVLEVKELPSGFIIQKRMEEHAN